MVENDRFAPSIYRSTSEAGGPRDINIGEAEYITQEFEKQMQSVLQSHKINKNQRPSIDKIHSRSSQLSEADGLLAKIEDRIDILHEAVKMSTLGHGLSK